MVDLPEKDRLLHLLEDSPTDRAYFLSSMSNTAHNWIKNNMKSNYLEYKITDHELVLNLPLSFPQLAHQILLRIFTVPAILVGHYLMAPRDITASPAKSVVNQITP
jgi:hypothetical protein